MCDGNTSSYHADAGKRNSFDKLKVKWHRDRAWPHPTKLRDWGSALHGEIHLLGAVGYQARTSPFLSFWIFKAAGLSGATARITAPVSDRDSSLTAFSHSSAVDKPTK